MIRKAMAVAGLVAGLTATAAPAYALDCRNVDRHVSAEQTAFAATGTPILNFPIGYDPTTGKYVIWDVMPEFQGNWYLLAIREGTDPTQPGDTLVTAWWGFIPPGTVPGLPGSNGNYTNGQVDDLLGMAACAEARQAIHGIQSQACAGS